MSVLRQILQGNVQLVDDYKFKLFGEFLEIHFVGGDPSS